MSMLGKRTHAESTMDTEIEHTDDVQEAVMTDCVVTTTEERMIDCDVAAFLAKKTLPHPADMPLQYSYSGDTFYVRDCYPVYYDKITECFQEEDVSGLTLTGSTGVGTSVFMAYFFLRHTLERPKATIVMTAFSANSNIAEAAVWKDGKFESKNSYVDDIGSLSWQFRDDPDVLFLIDGPPNQRPREHRYIVFTCREEQWFHCVRKESTHSWLYMPPWHETELVDAVDKLNLRTKFGRLNVEAYPRRQDGRHDQEVLYRFDVFGGVARPCLTVRAHILDVQLTNLKRAGDVCEFIAATTIPRDEYDDDLLYHLVPREDAYFCTRKVASPFAAQLLELRVKKLEGFEQWRMNAALQGVFDVAPRRTKGMLELEQDE